MSPCRHVCRSSYLCERRRWRGCSEGCCCMSNAYVRPISTYKLLVLVLAVASCQTSRARVLHASPADVLRSAHMQDYKLVEPFRPNLATTPTPEEAEVFLRTNLDPQLLHWRQQQPGLTVDTLRQFTKDLAATILRERPWGMRDCGLVVLRNNTLTMLKFLRGRSHYQRWEALAGLVKDSRLTFPDSAFIVNLDDYTICDRPGYCAAPVFSTHIRINDTDLLLPVTNHQFELQSSDWQEKLEVAFGRASHNYFDYHNSTMNTRVHLALGALQHPKKLNFFLVNARIRQTELGKYRIRKAKRIDIPDHLLWKYLISTDGTVSSTRLAKLLLMNSVVLKEDSPFVEYYYKSLQPWVHFVPFQSGPGAVSDILAAVDRLRGDDTLAQKLARTGQEFAAKFLLHTGRAWYLRELLLEYNKLFGAGTMEQWVAQQGPEALLQELNGLRPKPT